MKRKIKTIVFQIDKRLFHGRINRMYKKIKGNNSFFGKKDSVVISEPVVDIVLMQYNQQDNLQYQFYDLAVRVLAIENYYDKNEYGFDLYKKMHMLGGNYGQINLTEDFYNQARKKNKTVIYGKVKEEHSIEQFKRLIRSYEANGYNEDSIVMADRNLLNMNGSHRIALGVYRGQDFINVEVHDQLFKRRFNLDWFWKVGFEKNEIKIISEKMSMILQHCREELGEFYCILYPPAEKYFNEITEDIKEFSPDNIAVTGIKDYRLERNDFVGLIKIMYSFDSILTHNLERKLFYILQASDIVDNFLPFRILSLKINNPMYRLKEDNGLPESTVTVRLKDAIRGRYKVKEEKFKKHYIGDYAHDVIIHSTDNYLSNHAFKEILNINRNISDLFKELDRFAYGVVESSSDKISEKFPCNFYLNDDIDILVMGKDLIEISNIIEMYCKSHFTGQWISIENIESDNGRRVRVLLRKSLVVMFDLMCKMPGISHNYIQHAVCSASGTLFKHLSLQAELNMRLAKYKQSKTKKWHAEFIKLHIKDYQFDFNIFEPAEEFKNFFESEFVLKS